MKAARVEGFRDDTTHIWIGARGIPSADFPKGGPLTHIAELVFKPVDQALELPVTVTVDDMAIQSLMDNLWQAGFRPSDWRHHGPEHLEDMRRIAFGFLAKMGVIDPGKH